MSKNNEKKQDDLEFKLWNRALSDDQNCYYPKCSNIAIRSHILQENGILSLIAENGKFMEHGRPIPFRPVDFYLTGINASKMFTFKGFCNEHDTKIFKEIENGNINFNEYSHQLLFSYRGLLNDLYTAEVSRNYANKAIHNENFSENRKIIFLEQRNREQLKVKDLLFYKKFIEDELWFEPKLKTFSFYSFCLPRFDIATSTIFGGAVVDGITSYLDLNYTDICKRDPYNKTFIPVSQPVFINLIPQPSSLLFILGYFNTVKEIEGISIDHIPSLTETEALNLIGNILPKIEKWAISKSLYAQWKETGKIEELLNMRSNWRSKSVQLFRSEQELESLKKNNYTPFNPSI